MQSLIQGSTLQGGKYIIKKVLGQGGFGITYLAEHDLLRKQVAIKEFFMKEYCNRKESTSHVSVGTEGSEDLVKRFRQKFLSEARKIAHLQHANIIRISDVFEENSTAYYVMDYCEGGSLADLLNDNPNGICEDLALKYIRQVASAIEYVHVQNINHLDIKPANILLDAQDNTILIDFGISKHYDAVGSQTSTTPVGISHGYAAIEQYRQGGVSQFSPATDIYSLGATLFKLITGQTPPDASIIGEEGLPSFSASENIKRAIECAMQFRRSDRPKNIPEWLVILNENGYSWDQSQVTNPLIESSSRDVTLLITPNEKIKEDQNFSELELSNSESDGVNDQQEQKTQDQIRFEKWKSDQKKAEIQQQQNETRKRAEQVVKEILEEDQKYRKIQEEEVARLEAKRHAAEVERISREAEQRRVEALRLEEERKRREQEQLAKDNISMTKIMWSIVCAVAIILSILFFVGNNSEKQNPRNAQPRNAIVSANESEKAKENKETIREDLENTHSVTKPADKRYITNVYYGTMDGYPMVLRLTEHPNGEVNGWYKNINYGTEAVVYGTTKDGVISLRLMIDGIMSMFELEKERKGSAEYLHNRKVGLKGTFTRTKSLEVTLTQVTEYRFVGKNGKISVHIMLWRDGKHFDGISYYDKYADKKKSNYMILKGSGDEELLYIDEYNLKGERQGYYSGPFSKEIYKGRFKNSTQDLDFAFYSTDEY